MRGMQRDPAFLWESEALREASGRTATPRPEEAAGAGPAGPPTPPAVPASEPESVPEGTMLIPIAAWDKMLMQLGNLHEAGQELAEARERAGRAETEATFLRERLAELREQLAEAKAPSEPEPQPTEGAEGAEASGSEPLWRYVYGRWRQWRAR